MPRYFFLFIAAGTLLMIVVMNKTGAPLKTDATPMGILNLEFAYNSEKATIVVKAWQPDNNIDTAKINTQYDFIFLLFYAAFLYLGCKMVALSYTGRIRSIGSALAACAIAAGVLDVLENLGMLATLNGHINDTITLLTVIFSIIKWILALFALLYFIIFGVLSLLKRIKD
ncbi:MAG: hypothetical protein IPP72_10550 [Chitinophagaceae bacterium]|nr:hypothetical protein [Chitinophagaceae bacterium]